MMKLTYVKGFLVFNVDLQDTQRVKIHCLRNNIQYDDRLIKTDIHIYILRYDYNNLIFYPTIPNLDQLILSFPEYQVISYEQFINTSGLYTLKSVSTEISYILEPEVDLNLQEVLR